MGRHSRENLVIDGLAASAVKLLFIPSETVYADLHYVAGIGMPSTGPASV